MKRVRVKVCRRCVVSSAARWRCRECGRLVCEHLAGFKDSGAVEGYGSCVCSSCCVSSVFGRA